MSQPPHALFPPTMALPAPAGSATEGISVPVELVEDAEFDLLQFVGQAMKADAHGVHGPGQPIPRAAPDLASSDGLSPSCTAAWESLPAELRRELAGGALEQLDSADYEGLGAPYDEDARGLAAWIAAEILRWVALEDPALCVLPHPQEPGGDRDHAPGPPGPGRILMSEREMIEALLLEDGDLVLRHGVWSPLPDEPTLRSRVAALSESGIGRDAVYTVHLESGLSVDLRPGSSGAGTPGGVLRVLRRTAGEAERPEPRGLFGESVAPSRGRAEHA